MPRCTSATCDRTATHADVMFAVLNQVDRLSDGERADAAGRRAPAAGGRRPRGGAGARDLDGCRRRPARAPAGADRPARGQAVCTCPGGSRRGHCRRGLARHGGTAPMAGSDDGFVPSRASGWSMRWPSATGLDAVPREAAGLAARRSRRAAGWPPFAQFRTGTSGGPRGGGRRREPRRRCARRLRRAGRRRGRRRGTTRCAGLSPRAARAGRAACRGVAVGGRQGFAAGVGPAAGPAAAACGGRRGRCRRLAAGR